MQIVAGMREHHLRVDAATELGKHLLHLGAGVREVRVAEAVHLDGGEPTAARNASALARASRSRSPDAARTTQCTSRSGTARVSVSSVAPQPISTSSA